ncbi:hypothetical protein [Actinoplanes philippinensis]
MDQPQGQGTWAEEPSSKEDAEGGPPAAIGVPLLRVPPRGLRVMVLLG